MDKKKDSRPELAKVNFIDFVQDCCGSSSIKLHFVMNKHQIKKFVKQFDEHFNYQLLTLEQDESSDNYASKLFSLYLSRIRTVNKIYPSYLKMLRIIYEQS